MRLLAELERSPAGRAICDHVRDVVEAYESELSTARDSGLALLRALLGAWLSQIPTDSTEATELRMLRLRLEETPGPSEMASLLRRIQGLTGAGTISAAQAAPSPVSEAAPVAPIFQPAPAVQPQPAAGAATTTNPDALTSAIEELAASELDDNLSTPILGDADSSELAPGNTYRRHLAEKRERIQKIQEALVQHVNDVIKQNEKFGVLLEIEHASLRQADNLEDLEDLKTTLVSEVGKLRDGHQTLTRKLDTASKYLQIIGTEGQHLNEELTRAHILSETDELTGLANRRAFLRRLEDEVARVQRYGYPLSLALMDMDSFKAVNDKYGHGAGDEVLRNFAANMLSIFRHHDMAARYGGEEFVVLLPNTDRNGALRALEKVRKKTSESSYQLCGKAMPMPTFSAGVSLYRPGETPGNLIERADKALYQAKRLGRNRIELDQSDGVETAVVR
ncbi:MAG: diguanylate cyclase [Chromatiales bacterium]|jgi:diguanylate cyclase (GGDEF)-like protein|nr:diguanylate cyclase [Chromatiales bacterium]